MSITRYSPISLIKKVRIDYPDAKMFKVLKKVKYLHPIKGRLPQSV